MKFDVKLYYCSWICEEYFVNICLECGFISFICDLLLWWFFKKDICFEVCMLWYSWVCYEFINDEEGVFLINNIVLWFYFSNRLVVLFFGLWEVVIEEVLFCVIVMVGLIRKGKEFVFECKFIVI